jgi:hypothetical protein
VPPTGTAPQVNTGCDAFIPLASKKIKKRRKKTCPEAGFCIAA